MTMPFIAPDSQLYQTNISVCLKPKDRGNWNPIWTFKWYTTIFGSPKARIEADCRKFTRKNSNAILQRQNTHETLGAFACIEAPSARVEIACARGNVHDRVSPTLRSQGFSIEVVRRSSGTPGLLREASSTQRVQYWGLKAHARSQLSIPHPVRGNSVGLKCSNWSAFCLRVAYRLSTSSNTDTTVRAIGGSSRVLYFLSFSKFTCRVYFDPCVLSKSSEGQGYPLLVGYESHN